MRERHPVQPGGHSLHGTVSLQLPQAAAWCCLAVPRSSGVTQDSETGRGHSTGQPPCSAISGLEVMPQPRQPWPSLRSAGLHGRRINHHSRAPRHLAPLLHLPQLLGAELSPVSAPQSHTHQPGNATGHILATAGTKLSAVPPPLVSCLPLGYPGHRQSSKPLAGSHPSLYAPPHQLRPCGGCPAPPWVQISHQPI